MRPRRTVDTDVVFQLPGGNEDNDLWVKRGSTADGHAWLESYWELTDQERELIATGSAIVLRTFGAGSPPLALYVGDSIQLRS